MARSSYQFQKRQKELARKKKKELKRQRKFSKNESAAEEGPEDAEDSTDPVEES